MAGVNSAEIPDDPIAKPQPPTGVSDQATPPPAERRRFSRRPVDLPAVVNILVEEMTFSPFHFECVCQNISRSGALVIVRDLRKDQFVQMIRRPRYVRIGVQPPDSETLITLFGKLIWFDFKETPDGTVCKLASSFEPMKDETIEALDRCLEWLADQADSK